MPCLQSLGALDSQVAVRSALRSGRYVHLTLRAATGGVKVGVTPRAVGLSLKVRRPLAPPKAYGLQPFKVNAALPAPAPEQLSAACGVLSGGVRATLHIERARRTDPLHVKLTLGSIRPKPELLGEGWAQRPPVVHTRFTTEQRAVLMELFEKSERPNDTQMFESFKARFSNADGPYARALRLTRAQIKSFMSTEKGRRKKAAAAGVVAAALQDGSLQADDDEGDEGDDGCDGGDDEAQRREAALSGAGGSGAARGAARGAGATPPVAEMRKAAAALGWAKEAKAAKGKKAVLAVLQQAQAAPKRVEARPLAAAAGSGSDGSSSEDEEDEEEDGLLGADVYPLDSLRAKRRRGGCVEYLVKWKGWSSKYDSWEPTSHIPQCVQRPPP